MTAVDLDAQLADALSATFARTFAASGHAEARQRAVAHVVRALAAGSAAVRWSDFEPAERDALVAWPALARGAAIDGAVLVDDLDSVYLTRCWRQETRLARALAARIGGPDNIDPTIAATVAREFGGDRASAQARAVLRATHQRLTVIAGGPGTGKTWTIARIVSVLLEVGRLSPDDVALAAPTGKAATRLGESLRSMRGVDAVSDWDRVAEPMTLHALLGVSPGRPRARFHAGAPLPQRLVIVDEASMVDLAMMARLLDALAADARLVLVGDPDQLAAVEAGAVLAALRQASKADPRWAANLVELDVFHRTANDRALAQAIGAVRRGDGAAIARLLSGPSDGTFVLRSPSSDPTAVLAELIPSRPLGPQLTDYRTALDALRGHIVLAALNDGRFGVAGLNATLRRLAAGPVAVDIALAGEPLVLNRSRRELGIANGELGIRWRGSGGPIALFARPPGDPLEVAERDLPDHLPGYALTVHKAQGSEFDRVVVVLPPNAADGPHPLLTREWLYTAISRARTGVTVIGELDTLLAAVATPGRRHDGLGRRLVASTSSAADEP